MPEQKEIIRASNLRELVEAFLENHESLRGNDNALVCNVWCLLLQSVGNTDGSEWQGGYAWLIDMIQKTMSFIDTLGLPSYDTITRIRRDIQRKKPELQPKDPIRKLRKEKQERIEKIVESESKRKKLNAWLKQGEQLKHE